MPNSINADERMRTMELFENKFKESQLFRDHMENWNQIIFLFIESKSKRERERCESSS